MADDDFDRPHYHNYGVHQPILNGPCTNDDCIANHYVVVALDDYRALVAAARDRHPTNHQHRAADPATSADDNCECDKSFGIFHYNFCPLYTADS